MFDIALVDIYRASAHIKILPGVTIGDGAMVAVGAPMSIIGGVPAKKIKDVEE